MTKKRSSEILVDKVGNFFGKRHQEKFSIWLFETRFSENRGECFIGSEGWTSMDRRWSKIIIRSTARLIQFPFIY